ncbi:hypothetical protein IJ818_02390 [bacterium]|nr:hypothetical protein [bacterium]
MGLAANQARLLTLTSRMHDLELQCMRYSNEKIVMSALTSNIAIEYNQRLEAANAIDGDWIVTSKQESNTTTGGETTTLAFNYSNLINNGYTIKDNRTNGDNNNVDGTNGTNSGFDISSVVTPDNMPTTMKQIEQLLISLGILGQCGETNWATHKADGTKYDDNDASKPQRDAKYMANKTFHIGGGNHIPEGSYVSIKDIAKYLAKDPSKIGENADYQNDQFEFDYDKLADLIGSDNVSGSGNNGGDSDDLMDKIKTNPQELIDAILRGDISVLKDGKEVTDTSGITVVKSSGSSSSSYTEIKTLDFSARQAARDDAQSWYEKETGKLTLKEKMLDMKMKNAETQYQACCTEYDSVKSLIDENADRSFSVFG